MKMILKKFFLFPKESFYPFLSFFLLIGLSSSLLFSVEKPEVVKKEATGEVSKKLLFNYLPLVAATLHDHYVDPSRIDPEKMLIAILNTLETKISKLVITLPPSLKNKGQKNNEIDKNVNNSSNNIEEVIDANFLDQPAKATNNKEENKETLILQMGNKTTSFKYEKVTSIWGLIFFLRDVLAFVEEETQKQGIMEKSKAGVEKIDLKELENSLINAMLQTCDPHSSFYNEKKSSELTLTTKGEFGGIGIIISVRDGALTVISPVDNTPASKVGMKPNDKIVEIDGQSAIGMDLNDAVDLLRGEPNSVVRVTVERVGASKPIELSMKRAIIKVESVLFGLLDNEVGYLRIKTFQGKTSEDVKAAILEMKKKSGNKLNSLVLDLRNNPGGLLAEAISVSELFLDAGKEIVSTKGALESSKQVEVASKGQLDKNLKIAVLINEGSASASEIIAGALYDRAIIIGKRSFGKGSVQLLFNFPADENPHAQNRFSDSLNPTLKLTIAEYRTAGDKTIQTVGISPDLELNEVYATKLDSLSLFPDMFRREVDLEEHLSVEKHGIERSLFSLDYLMENTDESLEEKAYEASKIDINKLKKDFSVNVAYKVLASSLNAEKAKLIGEAKKISIKLAAEEEKKIIAALKKHNINWTVEEDVRGEKKVSYSITQNKSAKGGEKLKVSIKVKNTSEKPLYRIHGITHSKTGLFDNREFLFGKLNPGQAIERTLEVELPKDVVSRKDYFTLELRDYTLEKIDELKVPLTIEGLKRPRLAHTIVIDDTKSGNADGVVQTLEDVNLTIWLKNVGEGTSFEPTILLRNESTSKVFLKTGRETAKDLSPGKEMPFHFSFKLKEPADYVDFEIQIFDRQIHDVWRDKIRINVGNLVNNMKIANIFVAAQSASIDLFSASFDGEKIATLKQKAILHVLKEDTDKYLVKVTDDLVGFVKKSEVSPVTRAKNSKLSNDSSTYEINYNRIPAKVDLKFADGAGFTKDKSGKVFVDISGASKVSEVLMYVNGKKVLYKNITKPSDKESFTHIVDLVPGVNNVSVLAREDDFFGQLQSLTIFYDEKQDIFFKPPVKDKI